MYLGCMGYSGFGALEIIADRMSNELYSELFGRTLLIVKSLLVQL